MAEGTQPPRGLQSPVPRPAAPPATMEGAMLEMQDRHRMEIDGLVDSMMQMREDFRGQIQVLTEQGRRHEQHTTGHAVVKQIGDVHWTLRNICRAPDLSQANLADFDQWSQEMMHTIEAAQNQREPIQPGQHRVHLRIHQTRAT